MSESDTTSSAAKDISKALTEMASPPVPPPDFAEEDSAANRSPIVRMVNAIIVLAIDTGASDIHIEPEYRNTGIRYRVDGVLHEQMVIPKHIHSSLIRRLQIMADIPFYRSEPQTGIIPIRHNQSHYQLRVTTVQAAHGIMLSAHILDTKMPLAGWEALGMSPLTQQWLYWTAAPPQSGLIVIAGNRGAGRTTTIASLLWNRNSITRKQFFLQRHLEYQIAGITNILLCPDRGMGIETVMESVLRQDADTIALELDSAESVRAASQAIEAGVNVYGIVDAPSATAALRRLTGTMFTPQFVATHVRGILAQHLAPRVCPDCVVDEPVPTAQLFAFTTLRADDPPMTILQRGAGCEACRGRGSRGRIGLFEFLPVAQVADALLKPVSDSDLRIAVQRALQPTLRQDAFAKAKEGILYSQHLNELNQSLGAFG